jgi:hypothetical protein
MRPSAFDATLCAAIERVVISRTTIEIEPAEGMASLLDGSKNLALRRSF